MNKGRNAAFWQAVLDMTTLASEGLMDVVAASLHSGPHTLAFAQ